MKHLFLLPCLLLGTCSTLTKEQWQAIGTDTAISLTLRILNETQRSHAKEVQDVTSGK